MLLERALELAPDFFENLETFEVGGRHRATVAAAAREPRGQRGAAHGHRQARVGGATFWALHVLYVGRAEHCRNIEFGLRRRNLLQACGLNCF